MRGMLKQGIDSRSSKSCVHWRQGCNRNVIAYMLFSAKHYDVVMRLYLIF
jgi:hypothetical protein